MRDRLRFGWQSLVNAWNELVRFWDHLEVVLFLIVGALTIAGIGAVLAYTDNFRWALPVAVCGGFLLLFFEGAYQSWKATVARGQDDRRGLPLEILDHEADERGGILFMRARVRNPNPFPVSRCYLRVVRFEAGGSHKDYRGPPAGYHFPWSTYGGKSTEASIGRESEDFADLFFVQGQEAKKCATVYLNESTQKIEARSMVIAGEHKAEVEVGSKADDIPPARYTMTFTYRGGFDFAMSFVKEATSGSLL